MDRIAGGVRPLRAIDHGARRSRRRAGELGALVGRPGELVGRRIGELGAARRAQDRRDDA